MMKKREGANGIRRRIEDKLGPLRASGIFKGDDVHAGAIQQG